jgi:hypothetical protein
MSRSHANIVDLEEFRRRRARERTSRPELASGTANAAPPVVWVPVWWYWMPVGP